MANDLTMLRNHLADRKISYISFERLLDVHPRFTEEYIIKLIEKFPNDLRMGKLKGGKAGIKLLE